MTVAAPVPYMRRILAVFVAAAALLLAACGGSADPEPPAPSTFVSDAISEADAVAKAEVAAVDQGFSVDGLEVKPTQLFGEWQVSFEPANSDSLEGGFLVVLNAETGELLDVVTYR